MCLHAVVSGAPPWICPVQQHLAAKQESAADLASVSGGSALVGQHSPIRMRPVAWLVSSTLLGMREPVRTASPAQCTTRRAEASCVR